MERYYITIVAFLLFGAVHVNGQFMPGNVVVHSDPRLAVLLKKNPVALPPPTPVSYPDEAVKKKHNTSIDDSRAVKKHQLPDAPTHDFPVAPAHEIAANTVTVEKKDGPPVKSFIAPSLHKDGRVIYSGPGYRVQIYNGSDREKAIKVKTEFMRLNPGMRTYLTYLAPHFRVKVGDYRNRSDAEGMLREAKSTYGPPSMIVPDEVTIHAN